MMITYDSSRTIAIQKEDDQSFWISMYSLETYEQTFHELVGGTPESYIKIKDIE
jgi:hypothetical protein